MTATADPVDANGPTADQKRVTGSRPLRLFLVGDVLRARPHSYPASQLPAGRRCRALPHKTFGMHVVTFPVAFAVVCSGANSASTSANLPCTILPAGLDGFGRHVAQGSTTLTAVALVFMLLLAVVDLRGAGGSVTFDVVLTSSG